MLQGPALPPATHTAGGTRLSLVFVFLISNVQLLVPNQSSPRGRVKKVLVKIQKHFVFLRISNPKARANAVPGWVRFAPVPPLVQRHSPADRLHSSSILPLPVLSGALTSHPSIFVLHIFPLHILPVLPSSSGAPCSSPAIFGN